MNKSATSILVWGIYATITGLTLLLIPNLPLTMLGLGASQEVYPRLLSAVVIVLGYYYLRAARQEAMTALYAWSVHARLSFVGVVIVLVVAGFAQPAILLFAGIELAGSLWTAYALRSEGNRVT